VNSKTMGPYNWARYRVGCLLNSRNWTSEEALQVIDDLEPSDLVDFKKAVLSDLRFEFLIHGNFLQSEAKEIVEKTRSHLNSKDLLASHSPETRLIDIPEGKTCLFLEELPNRSDQNSSTYSYIQVGLENNREVALLNLFALMIHQPCFDQLRTREQLGYLVGSGGLVLRGVQGLKIEVQSAVKDPLYLSRRIDNFLRTYRNETLEGLTGEELQEYIEALILQLTEKDKNLKQETERYWEEICCHRYEFNRTDVLADEVRKIKSKQEVIDFFDQFISPTNPKRKNLKILVFGNQHPKPQNDEPLAFIDENLDNDLQKNFFDH